MWLLILVTSYLPMIPSGRNTQEFTSEESCKAALTVAKQAYSTVNHLSYCISVAEFQRRENMKAEVKRLKAELDRF